MIKLLINKDLVWPQQDGEMAGSSIHISNRIIDFNNSPTPSPKENSPWEPGSTPEKFQHLGGAKNLRIDTLKRGRIAAFYPYQPALNATQHRVKRDPFRLWFLSHGREWEQSVHPAFLTLSDVAQEAHFCLISSRTLRERAWLRNLKTARREKGGSS